MVCRMSETEGSSVVDVHRVSVSGEEQVQSNDLVGIRVDSGCNVRRRLVRSHRSSVSLSTQRFPACCERTNLRPSGCVTRQKVHLILIPEENPIANESIGNTAVILSVLLCPSGKIPQNPYTKLSGAKYALTSYGGNGGRQSHPPASISGDGIFAGTGPAITTPPTVQH